jgi:hypothetical protein
MTIDGGFIYCANSAGTGSTSAIYKLPIGATSPTAFVQVGQSIPQNNVRWVAASGSTVAVCTALGFYTSVGNSAFSGPFPAANPQNFMECYTDGANVFYVVNPNGSAVPGQIVRAGLDGSNVTPLVSVPTASLGSPLWFATDGCSAYYQDNVGIRAVSLYGTPPITPQILSTASPPGFSSAAAYFQNSLYIVTNEAVQAFSW